MASTFHIYSNPTDPLDFYITCEGRYGELPVYTTTPTGRALPEHPRAATWRMCHVDDVLAKWRDANELSMVFYTPNTDLFSRFHMLPKLRARGFAVPEGILTQDGQGYHPALEQGGYNKAVTRYISWGMRLHGGTPGYHARVIVKHV